MTRVRSVRGGGGNVVPLGSSGADGTASNASRPGGGTNTGEGPGADTGTPVFSHILVGVDGSAEACRAAVRGACLAHALGARLTFLSVSAGEVRTRDMEEYARVEGVPDVGAPLLEADARECLDDAVRAARSCGLHDPATSVVAGDVVPAFRSAVRAGSVDCVVLGYRKQRLFETIAGTSLIDALMKEGSAAVLVIP